MKYFDDLIRTRNEMKGGFQNTDSNLDYAKFPTDSPTLYFIQGIALVSEFFQISFLITENEGFGHATWHYDYLHLWTLPGGQLDFKDRNLLSLKSGSRGICLEPVVRTSMDLT